jgi:hypothetical protein
MFHIVPSEIKGYRLTLIQCYNGEQKEREIKRREETERRTKI